MSITETRPETDAASPASDVSHSAAEAGGLVGWLTTGDHKRIGRMWIATSLVFLVVGGVAGAVLSVERVDAGLQVLGQGAFTAVFTLHGTTTVFLFLVPAVLGLATYVVPLQVGASNVAFPRVSALGYWIFLLGGAVLLASYAAGGGPGGTDPEAVDLWLVALAAVNVATGLALLSVLTTALGLRAPGMNLRRTPIFTWSVVVGGGLLLLTTPVLIGGLLSAYVAQHYAGAPTAGWGPVAWWFGIPHAYLLAVPVAGAVAEIVPVVARVAFRRHGLAMGAIAGLGILGFGAFTASAGLDEALTIGVAAAAVLPALLLLALLADAVRRGSFQPAPSLLFALAAAALLAAGAAVGALAVIEPLELDGTTWLGAHVHLTLLGGATLGLVGALHWWAPKIWGRAIPDLQGHIQFALLLGGVLLLSLPDLVLGALGQPIGVAQWETESATVPLGVLAAIGGGLTVLGVLAVVASLLALRSGERSPDDPWGGHTLEWATTSPPPPGNFAGPVPPITSVTPLLVSTSTGPDEGEGRP